MLQVKEHPLLSGFQSGYGKTTTWTQLLEPEPSRGRETEGQENGAHLSVQPNAQRCVEHLTLTLIAIWPSLHR